MAIVVSADRVLALHVACDACGDTSRLTLSQQVEDWYRAHFLPSITRAEVIIAGRHRYLPVTVTR